MMSSTEPRLHLQAPAKINLFLKVTGRRPDGYHLLATSMQKLRLYDELLLEPCEEGIHLSCPGSELPENENNLVYRAAALFFTRFGGRIKGAQRGIRLTLTKRIPVAAGLGGGSSDAATALCGMNRIFNADCGEEELIDAAVGLGADVPLFVTEYPAAWATGIGERLSPVVPLRDCDLLLVNPDFSVSTKWVFETFGLTYGENLNNLYRSQDMDHWDRFGRSLSGRMITAGELENDLELVTVEKYPVIDSLKKTMLRYGATGAMMTGSGPTVFGIFPKNNSRAAENCLNELKETYSKIFLVQPLS